MLEHRERLDARQVLDPNGRLEKRTLIGAMEMLRPQFGKDGMKGSMAPTLIAFVLAPWHGFAIC